ncbi:MULTISPECIES: GNAT family N-acetyltransferase [Rhodomicrobium]|uniref:GNAT family N-acetyltransferase n=1 Tax=Rhodomicrobium TaxID=1068 RepID=UPI001FD91A61|nr:MULTISPECIES: GNAT family N-acetyltransferase [Rhodomicrobium]
MVQHPHWARAFANERKDHRYFELVEDTLHPEFDYRYFAVQDERGTVRAVQPFFIHDQDMLAGTGPWVRKLADLTRRIWPRFLLMRTLMVGCAAGEGHLDSSELPSDRVAQLLAEGMAAHAKRLGAKLIVMKEFPAADRGALQCMLEHGYTRVPSLPMTRVGIEYSSFEEYMTKVLSGNMRSNLRKKFKASKRLASLEMSALRDVSPIIDQVYPLYLAVYERSALRFEKLTKDYLCGIGRRMPDRVRFFVWRRGEQIVAFAMCMVDGDSVVSEYIGFDYEYAFDLNLYFIVVRDVMAWSIANRYQNYRNTAVNYEPKLHMRYLLDPLDLYVRHTSPAANFVLKYALPLMEPTRYDKVLKRFPNYSELWPPKS